MEDYIAELEEENEGLRERLSNIVDFASDEEEEAEEEIDDGDGQDDEGLGARGRNGLFRSNQMSQV